MLIFITCFFVFLLGMVVGISVTQHVTGGFKEFIKSTQEAIRKDNEGYMAETLEGFKNELAQTIFDAQSLMDEEDDDEPTDRGFLN